VLRGVDVVSVCLHTVWVCTRTRAMSVTRAKRDPCATPLSGAGRMAEAHQSGLWLG